VNLIGGTFTFAKSDHRHFVSSSSRRYKKNISPYIFENPEKILNLDLVRFQYNRSKREYHQDTRQEWAYGYIAEDVLEKGLHEIVGYNAEGEVEGLDYALFSVFVVELLKKQQKEIEFLKTDIKQLRGSND
jgi:hypothetical protein